MKYKWLSKSETAPKSEATLVKNILEYLKIEFPGMYFKCHGGPYQMVGLPDIIGVHRGRFIGIEVKLPGKEETLTKAQLRKINKISSCGGIAFMATSVDQVLEILTDEIYNQTR